MKAKALLIADDPAFESWLLREDPTDFDLITIAGAEPAALLAEVEREAGCNILFCEINAAVLDHRAELIEQIRKLSPELPIVGLAAKENSNQSRVVMRAGASEFLVLRRDDKTAAGQIQALLQRDSNPAPDADAQLGKLFLALGSHPSESIAFFAEHLGLAINERLKPGERVLLIDLATPAGAAAIFLNLTQTYCLLDALNDVSRCDQTLIDTAFSRHSRGLYVLGLPEDLVGRANIETAQLIALVQTLRKHFTYTIIAVDGHLPLQQLAALVGRADRALLLSDQSILKSRQNKYLLRALRQCDCPLQRMALVVDNYRRRLGLEPGNLAELFSLPLIATLQTESYNRIISMNSGEPLYALAPKDPYCAGLYKLAEMLIAGELKAVTSTPSLLERLLG